MVKMQKNVKFFVRVFPLKHSDENGIKIEANKKVLYALCLQDAKADKENRKVRYWKFYTDGIFFNSSQDEVYAGTMDGISERALKGGKAVIMTYGQTGAGKSLTLTGLHNNYERRGIIPRLLTDLFKEKERQKAVAKIDYWMSCIELKGREVKDLLGPVLIPSKHRTFDILKDIHHKKIVSERSALTLLFKAESRRSISRTAPYPASHLGHCVLTIYLRRTDSLLSGGCITYGKIHFIDLAGIDTGNETSSWKTCKDIGKANVVKSFLEQYLTQYSQHIPSSKPGMFVQGRTNNLAYYLADSLTPSCLICFIGHIYGSLEHLNITISTMKFGQRIADDLESGQLHYEREREPKLYMQALESEVEQQKRELEVITLLANDSNFCVSQSCYDLVKRLATSYLQGNDSEFLTLLSYGQAKFVLEIFRELYKKLEVEKQQLEIEQQQHEQSEQDNAQPSLTKMIKKSTSATYKNRKSKRSSKQGQINAPLKSVTSKTSTASQTDEKASTESLSNLVGESNKKGIGIGAGIVTSYEGAVAKSIKEGASAEPKETCDDVEGQDETKPQMGIKISFEGDDFISDPHNMPSADVLWEDFLNSVPEITTLKNEFDNLCEKIKEAQSDYISAAAMLSDCIVDVENTKLILAQQQKAWYVKVNYMCDEGSNITADIDEDVLIQSIKEKEIELKTNKEAANVSKERLISLSKAKLNIKHELEIAFQSYCVAKYGLPPLKEFSAIKEPEKNPCEQQFQMLQERLLLKNPVLANYAACYHV